MPVTLLAWLLAAAAITGGTHWLTHTLREQGREQCRAETQEAARMAERRARDRGDAAAARYAAGQAAHQARERIVIQEVQRIVERPVYAGTCFDADGLRIIADDIAGRAAPAASSPAPAVPHAARPR